MSDILKQIQALQEQFSNLLGEELEKEGLILHHIDIKKSPFKVRENTKACFKKNWISGLL